jgi:hypothetical protein
MKCNEVKVQKFAQNVTSLQVEVLQKQNTSLQLKVLKKLLKYCNALLLLRYFTTLSELYDFFTTRYQHAVIKNHSTASNLLESLRDWSINLNSHLPTDIDIVNINY